MENTPAFLRSHVKTSNSTGPEDNKEQQKRDMYKKIKQCSRWHQVALIAGWAGIFWGHSIPKTIINKASSAEFDSFLGQYCLLRPKILEMLEMYWPTAPQIFQLMGGNILIIETDKL
jgi:hypothetical protein